VIFLPLLALLLGFGIAFLVRIGPVTGLLGQYLALSCLAGLDSVCGGVRSGLEGKFRTDVFLTGFVSNIVIAYFLAWLGDQIYINLFLAVALVLATRIYTNLSLIRRIALTAWTDSRERRRLQERAEESR
jgi:small basic protein